MFWHDLFQFISFMIFSFGSMTLSLFANVAKNFLCHQPPAFSPHSSYTRWPFCISFYGQVNLFLLFLSYSHFFCLPRCSTVSYEWWTKDEGRYPFWWSNSRHHLLLVIFISAVNYFIIFYLFRSCFRVNTFLNTYLLLTPLRIYIYIYICSEVCESQSQSYSAPDPHLYPLKSK